MAETHTLTMAQVHSMHNQPSYAELRAENQRLHRLLAAIYSLATGGVDHSTHKQPNGLDRLAPEDARRVTDRILGRHVFGRTA